DHAAQPAAPARAGHPPHPAIPRLRRARRLRRRTRLLPRQVRGDEAAEHAVPRRRARHRHLALRGVHLSLRGGLDPAAGGDRRRAPAQWTWRTDNGVWPGEGWEGWTDKIVCPPR